MTDEGRKRYQSSDLFQNDGLLKETAPDDYKRYQRWYHDSSFYKREVYEGIIDDDELIELLNMENEEHQEDTNRLLKNDPEFAQIKNKIDSYDFGWAEGKPDYLKENDFVKIFELGKKNRAKLSHSESGYLAHHGVSGQKWGRRRYQNEDGSLTTLGRLHYGVGLGNNRYADSNGRLTAEGHQKVLAGKWQDDTKWLKKNDAKIRKTVERQVRPYLKATERQLRQEVAGKYKSGTKSKNYINAYNQRMAEIMNMAVKDLPTPNENAIRFVAKRGSMGVYTALTTRNYDIGSLKNGIYTSGRVAYRKDVVDKEWD